MNLRLLHGGAYISDINSLRNTIRANAVPAFEENITIIHPYGAQITLHINLAYQANSTLAPAASSLYIVGFTNNTGQRFNLNIIPFPFPAAQAGAIQLPQDGSYLSLGYNNGFANINFANLQNSIATVAGVPNIQGFGIVQRRALADLIIVSSEAIRFSEVTNGVNNILGNGNNFLPNWQLIHNWGGHILGSN